jgi:SAM-dependent methyltransferase
MDLPVGGKVLDVGCGSGVAMKLFTEYALKPTGITCVPEEFAAVDQLYPGQVLLMDMHDIGIYEGYADLVWCRHCLEHSPVPAFWLSQAHRAIKEDGWLYVEVPGMATSSRHETNASHFSVMGKAMWESLFFRYGFAIYDSFEINFTTQLGPDIYYCWLLKRR